MSGGMCHAISMKPQVFVRELTQEEKQKLQEGLRSSNAFVLRRCQILLASSRSYSPSQVANSVGCTSQTVRDVIHAFHRQGLACLENQSTRPKRVQPIFDEEGREALRELLHQSPRTFNKPTSLWTLELAAQVSFERGLSPHQVSMETIRQALKKLGKSWKRAKHWISSPDPDYLRKKGLVTG